MGADKTSVSFGDGTLLEWMVARFSPLFPHSFVVCREPARYRTLATAVVRDALDAQGALVGVYTALLASPTERVLCLACDMPFVTGAVLARLTRESEGHTACVPRHGGLHEPLCAVYSKALVVSAAECLAAGERRMVPLYASGRTRFVDMEHANLGDPSVLFSNLNNSDDLAWARAKLGEGRLPPRVRAFMQRVPVPVVAFVGRKKSGKTSLLEVVIGELKSRGLKVAAVKHDYHGFEADTPGTDSYRLRFAGAVVSVVSSADKYALVALTEEERSLEELVSGLPEDVDVVLAEGFKKQAAPKIEVTRAEDAAGLVAAAEELMAVVAESPVSGVDVPWYAPSDARGVADLVERWVREGAPEW